MATQLLIDTDVLIDYLRDYPDAVYRAAHAQCWALQYRVSRHSSSSREREEFPASVQEVVGMFALTLS